MEFFCQHPLSTFFFPPLHPPSRHAPLPLHPPQTPLVGLPLWIEERGLTKVSMVTVHSVNHAAADVSSPSLFPLSSLHCSQPHACTQPLPFFLLPSWALLYTFPTPYPHFPLQFEKTPFSRDRRFSLASLFTTSIQSQSPFIIVLISQDRQERGEAGWGRHNVHLTFNQRLSQHAASEQTEWSWSMCVLVGQRYEQKLKTSRGRILQYLQYP